MEIIISFGAGKFKGPILYSPELRRLSRSLASRRSRRPKRPMSPAGSPPSSAMSGPRTPGATTFTATSSSATMATRRARSCPLRRCRPGSDNPRDLWKWMQNYEDKTGGEVLAIAHNGNLSNGTMFPIIESVHRQGDRSRICRDSAPTGSGSTRRRRSRATARPIPSCRPMTSSPISSAGTRAISTSPWPKKPEMLEFEYARSALKNGLKLEAEARRQPLQVRHGRHHRRPYRPCHGRGGQFLRQDRSAGAEPRPGDASLRQQSEDRSRRSWAGRDGVRLCGRVGDRRTRAPRSSTP